jgi:hypothetical protein
MITRKVAMDFQPVAAKGPIIKATVDDFDEENQTVILSTETNPTIRGKKTTRMFTKRYYVTFVETYEDLARAGRGARIIAEIMMVENNLHLISFDRDF